MPSLFGPCFSSGALTARLVPWLFFQGAHEEGVAALCLLEEHLNRKCLFSVASQALYLSFLLLFACTISLQWKKSRPCV